MATGATDELKLHAVTSKHVRLPVNEDSSETGEDAVIFPSTTPTLRRSAQDSQLSPMIKPSVKTKVSSGKPSENDPFRNLAPILQAVLRGDLEQLTAALDAGCDIETRHPSNDRTSLVLAAYLGHAVMVEHLLKKGAKVNAEDRDQRTALHHAASNGAIESVNLLLSNGALVHNSDFMGETALHRASRYGRVYVCKILLANSPESLAKCTSCDGRNALHLAALYGQSGVVETICNHLRDHLNSLHPSDSEGIQGGDCHCCGFHGVFEDRDVYGCTPMSMAIQSHSSESIATLIRYSASGIDDLVILRVKSASDDKNVPNTGQIDKFASLVHYVVKERLPTWLLREVIDAGADVNLLDSKAKSALYFAIQSSWDAIGDCHEKNIWKSCGEMMEILICHGADFDLATSPPFQGKPLLAIATNHQSPKLLDCLDLSSPANQLSTFRGRCILRVAAEQNRWDIVQSLVEQASDIAMVGKALDEAEAIREAIWGGKGAGFIEWLIKCGATPLKEGHLPLAARTGDTEIAKVLLEHGANLWCKDRIWKLVPLQFATVHPKNKDMKIDSVRWFFCQTLKSAEGLNPRRQQRKFITDELKSASSEPSNTVARIKLTLEFGREFGINITDNRSLSDECLKLSIEGANVEATKYLLSISCDFDGTLVDDDGKRVPVSVLKYSRSPRPLDDDSFEICKKLVQEEIDRKQGMVRSEVNVASLGPWHVTESHRNGKARLKKGGRRS